MSGFVVTHIFNDKARVPNGCRCWLFGRRNRPKPVDLMKARLLPIALCLCSSVVFIAVPSPLRAGGAEKSARIYDESANGDKQVADAMVTAKREHKHILLQLGANWCGWCLKLHKLFESDKSVHEELSAHYVLLLIDVNQDHNKDLVLKYGADHHGIPFFVVLDSDGKVVTTKDTGELEEGDHHSPQKVLGFLKEWEHGAAISASVGFAPNPKVTFIRLEDLNGGLKRAWFKADHSGPAEILCRVHVEQVTGGETTTFSIPAGGSSFFSFFVRPGDTPKITGEVIRSVPVSRFTVPMPAEVGAAKQPQPFSAKTNTTSLTDGSGR
jgi:thioredoxin-related protein